MNNNVSRDIHIGNGSTSSLGLIMILIFAMSCRDVQDNKGGRPDKIKDTVDNAALLEVMADSLPAKDVTIMHSTNTDTMQFIRFSDDGDYAYLLAVNNKDTTALIYDGNFDFYRGDLLELHWKVDTIRVAGDGDTPALADCLVSARKLNDGKVSIFRKRYSKELKYIRAADSNYSTSYLDRLHTVVEYYIANSSNELLNLYVKQKEDLTYSIEEKTKGEKAYTMMGIATVSDHKFITLQWLYFDYENYRLYVYDLPNDKLIEFKE